MNRYLVFIMLAGLGSSSFDVHQSAERQEDTPKLIRWLFLGVDSQDIIGFKELMMDVNNIEKRIVKYEILEIYCEDCYSQFKRGCVLISIGSDSSFIFKYDTGIDSVGNLQLVDSSFVRHFDSIATEIDSLTVQPGIYYGLYLSHQVYTRSGDYVDGIYTQSASENYVYIALRKLLDDS